MEPVTESPPRGNCSLCKCTSKPALLCLLEQVEEPGLLLKPWPFGLSSFLVFLGAASSCAPGEALYPLLLRRTRAAPSPKQQTGSSCFQKLVHFIPALSHKNAHLLQLGPKSRSQRVSAPSSKAYAIPLSPVQSAQPS